MQRKNMNLRKKLLASTSVIYASWSWLKKHTRHMIHDTCCRCRCCCCWWWRHTSISWKRIRWSLQHLNAQQISFKQSLDQTISIGRRELLPTYGTMDAHGLMDMKTYDFFWQVSIERTWQYLTTFWRKWCLNNVMLILLKSSETRRKTSFWHVTISIYERWAFIARSSNLVEHYTNCSNMRLCLYSWFSLHFYALPSGNP